MARYKVIQDIEAEDKLLGPLTLRQFIYGAIAAVSAYLGFLLATKGVGFMLVIFAPITLVCGFFAFPWGQDQPTELWALAKIRFYIKPRRRVWDQSGAKDMVTVTAPKVLARQLTNGLNQDEVHSRLRALADTIDSRGWAIKNINVNLTNNDSPVATDTSDRLVQANSLPQEVSSIDVRASDDILDEAANPIAQHFDNMISTNVTEQRQRLIAQMQQAPILDPQAPLPSPTAPVASLPVLQAPVHMQAQPLPDQWFVSGPTPTGTFQTQAVVPPLDNTTAGTGAPQSGYATAAMPTAQEEALVEKFRSENSSMSAAYGHLKTLKTPEQLLAEARAAVGTATANPPVTPTQQAAIINLANNDDLDVATIARQANEQVSRNSDGEVVVSLR